MNTTKLYKVTFIKSNTEDLWVEDINTPRVQVSREGAKLTSDEILALLKTIGEQNKIWEKLKILKQVRLVE
jgi:hypothetical protein